GVVVHDVKVPSNNVEEIMVSFTTVSGDHIPPVRGKPTALPRDMFSSRKMAQLVIVFMRTTDNNSPNHVTLSIVACGPGRTSHTTEGTTSTPVKSPVTIISETTMAVTVPPATETSSVRTSQQPLVTTEYHASTSSSREETSTLIESTTSHMTEETTKEFCEHMEYIDTLIASNSVTTKPEDIPNKEDFIKNGVNFVDTNPIVVIDMPSEGVVVHDVKVPSNNVEEIMVSFTTVSGDHIPPVRGKPTALPTDQFPSVKTVQLV
ncbi:unnamed protein product, partial [Rotaria sp. Silwood1]